MHEYYCFALTILINNRKLTNNGRFKFCKQRSRESLAILHVGSTSVFPLFPQFHINFVILPPLYIQWLHRFPVPSSSVRFPCKQTNDNSGQKLEVHITVCKHKVHTHTMDNLDIVKSNQLEPQQAVLTICTLTHILVCLKIVPIIATRLTKPSVGY